MKLSPLLLALPLAAALSACNQTASAPAPVVATASAPAPAGRGGKPVKLTRAEQAELAEMRRREACGQAAQRSANLAVGSAVLGGALDVAGIGMLGHAGWVTSTVGHTVANVGAVAAEQEMNVAVARGDC